MLYQLDSHHLHSCIKSVSYQCKNEGKNKCRNKDMIEDGHLNQNKITYIIELFDSQQAYFMLNEYNLCT